MSDVVLSVENVSKRFRIGAKPHAGTLREAISAAGSTAWRSCARLFGRRLAAEPARAADNPADPADYWALRDVSFEVRRGEVLGIVGRNGAGKSTLLKIISRITEPTTGRVGIRGRIGSLLEVGTGFHPDLTGRENIFLSGRILGMTRREMLQREKEIIAFAEVDDFLDTPVKRYSSGMYIRLAFAIAVQLDSEILILDEVLSVGDIAFQTKCLTTINTFLQSGRTVLVVGHTMSLLRTMCTRVLWLERGHIKANGQADVVIDQYLRATEQQSPNPVRLIEDAYPRGNEFVTIHSVSIPARINSSLPLSTSTAFEVHILIESHHVRPITVTLLFTLPDGTVALGTSLADSTAPEPTLPHGKHLVICCVPAHLLNACSLRIDAIVVDDLITNLYRDHDLLRIDLIDDSPRRLGWCGKRSGVIRPSLRWQVETQHREAQGSARLTNARRKVFGIGLNKTGTTSLEAALIGLGFQRGPQQVFERHFANFVNGNLEPFFRDVDKYEAFQDVPFSIPDAYRVIFAQYPTARYVLTIRDSFEQWHRSLTRYHATLFGNQGNLPSTTDLANATYVDRGWLLRVMQIGLRAPLHRPYDPDWLQHVYLTHITDVVTFFSDKPGSLLVLNPAQPDAYSTLARFLDLPAPSNSFPHLMKTDSSLGENK